LSNGVGIINSPARQCREGTPAKVEESRYGYSIYDALILAAALEADCDVLYTEDMQNGQVIGPLTIRNPFLIA
jgi:predicted nucleic acid-binding protein